MTIHITERQQVIHARWLVKELLCDKWEYYVECGFLIMVEELYNESHLKKVQSILREGWLEYQFGAKYLYCKENL